MSVYGPPLAPPEPETFFDAVFNDTEMASKDKIFWLHATCLDYWARLAAHAAVVDGFRAYDKAIQAHGDACNQADPDEDHIAHLDGLANRAYNDALNALAALDAMAIGGAP